MQTVNKAATGTMLISAPNPSNPNQMVNFVANVVALPPSPAIPTGAVQFFDGANALGAPVALSNGAASFTASFATSGSHSITAVYSGSADYNGSTSPPWLQGVAAAAPTQTNDDGTKTAEVTVDSTIVTTTFGSGSTGGTTSVAPLAPLSLAAAPSGYVIDNISLAFQIETTATTNNQPITLCFRVPSVNDEAIFNSLTIIHYGNGQPVVEPTIRNFAERTLCATVTSLSPFVLARAIAIAPLALSALAAPAAPVAVNTPVAVSASLSNPDQVAVTASVSWGDGGASAGVINNGVVSGSHSYPAPGVYTVKLQVTDNSNNAVETIYRYVVVYDPQGGFVTGGGWINSPVGAYPANPALTGKANFGFAARYRPGANAPDGQTQFNFHVANFNFLSTSYQWLVVAGARAQFKGEGTINRTGSYGFLLTAIDGQVNGGGGVDKFRIKIWDKATGAIVYDNQMGAADDANPSQALGGGSIVVHR
jgi:hypothetical protein